MVCCERCDETSHWVRLVQHPDPLSLTLFDAGLFLISSSSELNPVKEAFKNGVLIICFLGDDQPDGAHHLIAPIEATKSKFEITTADLESALKSDQN